MLTKPTKAFHQEKEDVNNGSTTIGRTTIGRTTISRSQLVAATIGRHDNWSLRQLVAYRRVSNNSLLNCKKIKHLW